MLLADSYDNQGEKPMNSSSRRQQCGENDPDSFEDAAHGHTTRLSSSEQPLLKAKEETAVIDMTLAFAESAAIPAKHKVGISRPIPAYSTTRGVNSGASSVTGPIAVYSTTVVVGEDSGSSDSNADGLPDYSLTVLIDEENSGLSNIVSGTVPTDFTLAIVGNSSRLLSVRADIPDYSTAVQIGGDNSGTSTAHSSATLPTHSRSAAIDNASNSGTSSDNSFIPTYSTAAYYDDDEDDGRDADNVNENAPNVGSAEKSSSETNTASRRDYPNDGYSYAAQDPVYEKDVDCDEEPAENSEFFNNRGLVANSGNSTISVSDLAQHSRGNIVSDGGQSSLVATHDDGYSTAIVSELPSNSGGSSFDGDNHSGASNISATSDNGAMAMNSGNSVLGASYSDNTSTAGSRDDISVAKNESTVADVNDGYSRTVGLAPSV